jgi:xanthine dehydrogenase accessory factor
MHDEQRGVYQALVVAQEQGDEVALATIISVVGSVPRQAGSKMLVRRDGSIVGTVGGGAMEAKVIQEAIHAIEDGKTRLLSYTLNDMGAGDPGVCGGTIQMFVEPVSVPPVLLVIGGGHVGRALAELGKWCGYRVILSDDREAYCNPTYLPGLDGYAVCAPGDVPKQVTITQRTYVAAVTRGMPVDRTLIPALLQTPAAYIGLIGSRRRWALTVKALQDEQGLSSADLQRIHAPIGLELNAETPHEIALSILAEITLLRRGGDGRSMKAD